MGKYQLDYKGMQQVERFHGEKNCPIYLELEWSSSVFSCLLWLWLYILALLQKRLWQLFHFITQQ
jgi:hypothetical protein